jgi:urea transporter/murein DD-endopeptidase MepM/ murein hydrolase activator NlpD
MQKIKPVYNSILNSYAQIFFSDGKLLGAILVLITFFNLNAGLSGLIAIVVSNATAYFMGLNKTKIVSGYYGFNSLLVGLGLGLYYNFSFAFLLVLVFTALLTFFITVVLEGWFAKYSLPYLSLPFLVGIWTVSLAARSYTGLEISEAGVYSYNDIFLLGGQQMLSTHLEVLNTAIPKSIEIYLKSLGAIFFQYNIYAGFIIAIALLINSRISFLLTLVGFYSAYYFYQFIGADLGELSYGFIGFNFILTAIAIGGYFIIPSAWSFVWVVLLTPLLSLLITGSSAVLGIFQLSTFALPFNVVVITFLYVLKFRERNFHKPELVSVQSHNPEKNLYAHLNYLARFGNRMNIPIHLPFYGEWAINQGYNGDITHQKEWRHALDFVIVENGKEYESEGKRVEDFYCYNKPILAPADGFVEEVVDGIQDNEVGHMDNKNNWGNTIVIKHGEFLYSQMSHIRKDSFQVQKGQYVKQGEVIAYVGNSGRSPFPHLHFQMQATPFVGSKTISYPISHYILRDKSDYIFKTASIPSLGDHISGIEAKQSLKNAFGLIPGQVLQFVFEGEKLNQIEERVRWEVYADFYNNTYLYCPKTKSYAYFKANVDELVFTGFKGNKKSTLYYFYLTAYRVIFGFYKDIELNDQLPLSVTKHYIWRFTQDFVSPFYRFIKPSFQMKYLQMEELFDQSDIKLESIVKETLFGKTEELITSQFQVDQKGISAWEIKKKSQIIKLRRVENED